jgi:hypothetical protein
VNWNWNQCGYGSESGFSQVSGSGFGIWIRIWIQECKNYPKKKVRNFMFLSAGCSLLSTKGFSCSLDVLYGGLGISKLQFFIKQNITFFNGIIVFQFLVIKTLDEDPDPDPDWYSA